MYFELILQAEDLTDRQTAVGSKEEIAPTAWCCLLRYLPPCDVNFMTVSLTVVMKSRNPSTVLVLSGPLGSSANPPDAT